MPPTEPDITDVQAQAEALLNRQVTLSAFDVLTEQTLTWTLGRQEFVSWLRLVARADGTAAVEADPAAVPDTLKALAAQARRRPGIPHRGKPPHRCGTPISRAGDT